MKPKGVKQPGKKLLKDYLGSIIFFPVEVFCLVLGVPCVTLVLCNKGLTL